VVPGERTHSAGREIGIKKEAFVMAGSSREKKRFGEGEEGKKVGAQQGFCRGRICKQCMRARDQQRNDTGRSLGRIKSGKVCDQAWPGPRIAAYSLTIGNEHRSGGGGQEEGDGERLLIRRPFPQLRGRNKRNQRKPLALIPGKMPWGRKKLNSRTRPFSRKKRKEKTTTPKKAAIVGRIPLGGGVIVRSPNPWEESLKKLQIFRKIKRNGKKVGTGDSGVQCSPKEGHKQFTDWECSGFD